ncbi:MAG: tetratricopeptide repeat protein [Bacteroidales bacterium]|nr:tetratricopeptide repeat protein [Bacteroidales bacterium]
MKKTLILAAAMTVLFLAPNQRLFSQTKDDAGNAYNNARTLAATDKSGALKGMIEVVSMCEKVGAEADDIKKMASAVIPDWQYQIANDLLKEKKYDEAIAAFDQTILYADKYGDSEKKEKSLNQMPKLYFFKGQDLLKAEKLDEALASFDKAIGYDADYTKAYYSKGVAFKKKNDYENMQKAMDKAFELGTKSNDTATAAKARDAMGSTFLSRANKAFSTKGYAQAIELANSSLSYTPNNSPAFLILAVSYNSTSKFDLAIDAAKKGLAVETKPEKQADFYFETGKAYEGKKDNANACANYKKVTVGPKKAAADYQIVTVLKCK